jgi:hypothetical protein
MQEGNFIKKFNETRRMERDVNKLMEIHKGEGGNPFLQKEETYGVDGGYFVGGRESYSDITTIDHNRPPHGQPGLWCQWTINEEGTELEWDGIFSNDYTEWLEYLIKHFFSKWGVILNGEVTWQGEDSGDVGKIVVVDNDVTEKQGRIVFD